MDQPVPVEQLPGFLRSLESSREYSRAVLKRLEEDSITFGKILQRWEEKYLGVDWHDWIRNPGSGGADYPTPEEIKGTP